uniref:Uncharacterized protein n=1 Tax=Anguilla anguilla TaxID=7936 RepID=A0A0E9Q6L0_ANGAN
MCYVSGSLKHYRHCSYGNPEQLDLV